MDFGFKPPVQAIAGCPIRNNFTDTDAGWVWGKHAVMEILRAHPGQVEQVVLAGRTEDRLRRELEACCLPNRISLVTLDSREFSRRVPAPAHQSIAARLKTDYAFVTLDELLKKTSTAGTPPPLLLALDHLQDPRNLGAIMRTAYCAGVDGILLPRDRAAPISGTVRKAASGALEHLRISQVVNLPRALDQLKECGFWIVSLEASGETDLYHIDYRIPLAVVIGGEGKGVSPLVLKKSDWVASIPLAGTLTSLNASVACGIALFEIRRQRTAG